MSTPALGYLTYLGRRLHLAPPEEAEILHELRAHIEDRARELTAQGLSSDEALEQAVGGLGPPDYVARQLYQVHSRGSWYHTALAVLPHILLSLMFGLHLWTRPVWVVLMLVLAFVISVVGWRKGRPRWTYPWLGYCLMSPIVSWGLAMSAVGYGAWGVVTRGSLPLGVPIYIASFAYIALSLGIVARIVSRAARPDWVMASLAVLPAPFLGYWFFYFFNRSAGPVSAGQPLSEVDSSAAAVFLVLAAATAIFFRIGRRLLRVALLVITAPSMIVLGWLSYQGGPDYVALFALSAISLAVLLSPALFDLRESDSGRPTLPLEQTRGGPPG